jgi:hypothetical protein
LNDNPKVTIRWHNKVEKYASEDDRAQGKPQEVIEWDKDDVVSLEEALALGFRINPKEVTQNGNDISR